MNKAIVTGDDVMLAKHIDIKAVQSDVLRQLRDRIGKGVMSGELNATEAAKASASADGLVTAMINPGAFKESLSENRRHHQLDTGLGLVVTRTELTTFIAATTTGEDVQLGFRLEGTTWRVVSMNMERVFNRLGKK